jgi:hypothetical protein
MLGGGAAIAGTAVKMLAAAIAAAPIPVFTLVVANFTMSSFFALSG